MMICMQIEILVRVFNTVLNILVHEFSYEASNFVYHQENYLLYMQQTTPNCNNLIYNIDKCFVYFADVHVLRIKEQ